MRNPWNIVRCKLGRHRWEAVRIGKEKGKECRHCKERIFDRPGADLDDVLRGAGFAAGGGTPGPF
jgi:hypothetical protein